MRNIKLTLEYDGTDFHGWQIQPGCRTIQGSLEQAICSVTQSPVRVIGAGRTDAGVHALGQVCNFFTNSTLSPETLLRAINALLPDDILVREAESVHEEFHARFKAIRRIYRYVITQKRRAVERNYMWYYPQPLNINAMQRAAEYMLGEHDCRAFGCTGSEERTTLCTILSARWESRGERLHFIIESNRFLRKMVRTIVGTLIAVGMGNESPESIQNIINAKDRRHAGFTAPACGLFLESVHYS